MVETILIASYTLITVGLLYFFLHRSLISHWSIKKQIIWWILFGFIFNFYSFSWLYTTYPIEWLSPGIIQIFGIFIIHLLLATLSGLCFFIVGFSFHTKITTPYKPLIFALSLVIAETLRSLAFSLLFYGTNTTINLHFTASTLGEALSPTPFIEYAYFGGTFALTGVLGYLLFTFSSKKNSLVYWKHGVGICILLIAIHYGVPVHEPNSRTTVGVITTNFPTTKDNEVLTAFKNQNGQIHTMTMSLSAPHPDIIVYPEDTRYLEFATKNNTDELASTFSDTLLIDGDTRVFNSKFTNVSLFFVPGGIKAEARGKSFLLPFNEYIPYIFMHIFSYFITKDGLDTYTKNHTYTPIHSQKTILYNGVRIGTLICSEIASYRTIQELRKENPSIVFFQSRLNVFHNNPWFMVNLYSFTKIAAAQLRRPLISSTNNAPSFIVSPYGKILVTIPTGFSTSTYTFYK
jgi:apolipoprotein N-acyltransferase